MSAKLKKSLSKIKKIIAGMTLVEVAIASVIFAIIVLATLSVLLTTQPAINTGYVQTHLDSHARLVLESVVNDIRRATTSSVLIEDDGRKLTMETVGTFGPSNSSATVPDSEIVFSLELAPGEILDNGIDDNGNGLLNEHHLVKEITQEGSAVTRKTVMAKNIEYVPALPAIDRRQLVFSQLDNKISVKMTLVQVDPNPQKRQNVIHRAIVETEVYILNVGG